jgi:hypothetical protein
MIIIKTTFRDFGKGFFVLQIKFNIGDDVKWRNSFTLSNIFDKKSGFD